MTQAVTSGVPLSGGVSAVAPVQGAVAIGIPEDAPPPPEPPQPGIHGSAPPQPVPPQPVPSEPPPSPSVPHHPSHLAPQSPWVRDAGEMNSPYPLRQSDYNGGFAIAPLPPGTLGQSYYRISHPVPGDEHPRSGMLAVRDNGRNEFLSVQTMGGVRMKSGIWLFESQRPLDPGVCQIVRVEARENPRDIEPYATKFVRLIPGRIVYLEF
jgi:hypothetical protein